MIVILSIRFSRSFTWCVLIIMHLFSLSDPAITFRNWLLLMMSSPLVGSSISNMEVLQASPKLISTFFFLPVAHVLYGIVRWNVKFPDVLPELLMAEFGIERGIMPDQVVYRDIRQVKFFCHQEYFLQK